jgi:hypothetical protein
MARIRKINEGFRFQDQRDAIKTVLNMCFNPVGLSSGMGFGVSMLYNFQCCIEGYIYSFTAASFTTEASYQLFSGVASAASQCTRLLVLTVNSAASWSWFAGSFVSGGKDAYFPESGIPASRCVVGFVRISGSTTISTTFGSNSLGAMNAEFFNVCTIPQGVILDT